jgi:hypothetical protein
MLVKMYEPCKKNTSQSAVGKIQEKHASMDVKENIKITSKISKAGITKTLVFDSLID